jgi:membrane fusion protein (multidrug efflux system)
MRNLWEKPEGKEPSVPQKLFDDAKTRREAALVRFRQAEAALRNADERLAEAVIRAPYDGVITDRLVDDGEPVNSAPVTQLVEIQETATLELEFSLPQSYLSRVSPGTPVYFRSEGVADGSEEAASIATVFPAVDEATRSFRCRAYVPNEDAHSRPGILVSVRILVREVKDVLAIPRKCLARSTRGWKVSTLAGGHASERDVEIGMEDSGRVEVREGLDASSKVWQPREVES